MEYSESLDQAVEYARSALALMGERKIPPNPNNFTVWFHYFSGRYPDLTRTLDILIGNQQEFTEARSADIFQKFFTVTNEEAQLAQTAMRAGEALAQILRHLGAAGEGSAEYGRSLESIGSRLKTPGGAADFASIIADALAATRAMQTRNRTLEEKLSASSQEINQLRDDLENMRREALTDGLTGIANRKLFDLQLRKAAMGAMEDGTDLCLLMLDIDHFKKFNDTYGHQVGDQVLRLLASILQDTIKGQDTAARYGGEEFTVILPETNLSAAFKVAQNIRKRVGTKEVINRKTNQSLGRITVSIGIAEFEFGERLAQFMARADEALYLAKNRGRDRVMTQRDLQASKLDFGK